MVTLFREDMHCLSDSHPATNVSLAGGNVQTDVFCLDGTSYTLSIPVPDQSYSIAADDDSWLPAPDSKSPLSYQGSATAGTCKWGFGLTKRVYFSALGVSAGVGNPPAAPGFTIDDTADPLKVKFHCNADNGLLGGSWSQPSTVNYIPK